MAEAPLGLVRVSGTLALSNAWRLRAGALKCLAAQPAAITLDVADLVLRDEVAVTMFATVARHAAAWPSVPVLLCGASAPLRRALGRTRVDGQVLVCGSLAEAAGYARNRRLPGQVRHRLPSVPASVTVARHVVVESCDRWRLPDLAGLGGLIATELVGNAVCHAGGDELELILSNGVRYLHVAVRDGSHLRPRRVGTAGETEPGGRGLLLVDALATHWGYTRTHDGKVTWASLALP